MNIIWRLLQRIHTLSTEQEEDVSGACSEFSARKRVGIADI